MAAILRILVIFINDFMALMINVVSLLYLKGDFKFKRINIPKHFSAHDWREAWKVSLVVLKMPKSWESLHAPVSKAIDSPLC